MPLSLASVCVLALSLAQPSFSESLDKPVYVFSSWQAGAVGDCRVTDKHRTADCEGAPGANGRLPTTQYTETYLNNQDVPGAPVGEHIQIMVKLREPVQGTPPSAADAEVTEIHQRDLQRQYYPRAALEQKLEGKASVDCTVRDNGQLDTCWVKDEMPIGSGFGGATLNLINLMKLASPLPADRKQSFDMTWDLPKPADQVLVNCAISPDYLTGDCTTDPDVDFPGSAQAVLDSLEKKPLHLLGAPIGQRIEIALLRSELEVQQSTKTMEPETSAYKPVRLTALNADDVLYYYPSISVRLTETGSTDVQCKVTDDGRLNECWAIRNQSSFDRLARAHLGLTEIVKMQPPTVTSPGYDRRLYTFRINWTLQ